MNVVFPLLLIEVSDGVAGSFRDEETFRHHMSLATDKAIQDGFFKKVRLFGADRIEHRVAAFELAGRWSLSGWMRRPREITVLELTPVGELSLSALKGLVESVIKSSPLWEDSDVEELAPRIEAADDFATLASLFTLDVPSRRTEELEDVEPKPLPRWVTIPIGIVLTPFALLCVFGSSTILLAPNVPPSAETVAIGTLFLGGSLWILYLSLRLLFVGPKGKSNLINPIGLRSVALVFAAIPIASLILGTFWDKPVIHSIMTVAYIGIVVRLWSLARHRSRNT